MGVVAFVNCERYFIVKLNVVSRMPQPKTAEGAPAKRIGAEAQLLRSVMTCLLWEKNAYSDGKAVAAIIKECVPKVSPEFAAAVAYHARTDMKLRHAPLLVMREMARHPAHRALLGKLMPDVIQRPDEITEFMAIYWAEGTEQPIANQVKKGLAAAFNKFSEYQLAKWNRDGDVRLRDVLFLVHAKPKDAAPGKYTKAERKDSEHARELSERERLFKSLVDDTLAVPDTWEVALSGGADKKATWERLMLEKKLGAQAFLMNLRNMDQAGVDRELMAAYAEQVNVERVLPYQFLTAARIMPKFEDFLEPMMFKCLKEVEKLKGHTVLLVDVSGSMDGRLSAKGEMTRVDAANGLAVLLREVGEQVTVFSFSNNAVQVAPRRGFALRDAIYKSQAHGGTYLGEALATVHAKVGRYDRLIVITDEQSHDRVADPRGLGYVINVATERHGVGYGKWVHIDGWSEKVIDYIQAYEKADEQ